MRFPGFEAEWKKTTLHSIAEIAKGMGISKDQLSQNGLPCILYGELYTKYKSEIITEIISRTDINSSNLIKSKANDVIIPSSGETAIDISTARCVPCNDILLGGDLNIIRLHNNDGRFLSYQLNGVRKLDIAKMAQGVSVVHLYGEKLKSLPVFMPDEIEQDKISSFLFLLDTRISTQNKIIEELKLLKSAIEEKLLGRILTFKGIGTQWYTSDLGNLTENYSCKNRAGSNYPVYSVTNDKGFIRQSELFEDRGLICEDICNYKIIHKGELAYNPARINVGSIAKYDGDAPCLISSLYVCLRARPNVDPEWLYCLLKSKRLIFYYNLYGEGGVRLYLFYPNFSRIKVLLPSCQEQSRIAQTINSIQKKIEHEEQLRTKYQQQKQYLLQNLFI